MAGSDTDTETTIHTELSAGDANREAYEPYRVGGSKTEVHLFRQWWLNNPLNNLWGSNKPNQWETFKKVQAGVPHAEAVKGGANVKLEDITQKGPSIDEILAGGSFDLQELPSDEAWCGCPDPAVYAAGTNSLSKVQLAEEVAKGNVVTLRQLMQHLATASEADLEVWRKVVIAQRLKEEQFIELPGGAGRVSVWDLWNYVKNNPELEALADRDPAFAAPVQGMTREQRIRAVAEAAPWKLCGNERHMVLPPEVAARLNWGLLAAGSWYSRRPTRWLKGLDGVKDFDYGLYVHEEAAQQALQEAWAGRDPAQVLPHKAFYRDALRQAPTMGMTLLAVASRPLPLEEVTQAWEQRLQQQIDRISSPAAGGSGQPKLMLSTSSSSAATGSGSGSESETDASTSSGSASSQEESSSSSELAVQNMPAPAAAAAPQAKQIAVAAAAAAKPAAPPAASRQVPAPAAAPAPPPSRSSSSAPAVSTPAALQQQALAQPAPAAVPAPPVASPAAAAAAAEAAELAPVREVAPQYQGLAQLAGLFGRERLASTTQLLDPRGLKLREGSTLIFTAHPTGGLLVQAISPGLVKEQRSYVLGSVQDPTLTQALLSMFMEPDHCLDPDFTAAAGVRLLGVINGQRLGQLQQKSGAAAALAQAADAEEASRQMLKNGKWGLPDVGKAPQQLPLVKGVRREVMYHQIQQAFESALRVAAAVQPPEGKDLQDTEVQRSMAWARRQAAEAELKKQLGGLGLDVSSLSLAPKATAQAKDLLSLARPLAALATAGGQQ